MNIFKRIWRRLTRKTTPDCGIKTTSFPAKTGVTRTRREFWVEADEELYDHLRRQALDQPPYIAVSDDGTHGIEEPPT